MPYLSLTPSVECVDDSSSKFYNRVVDRSSIAAPDWNSSEQMLRNDDLYRWGVLVEHNASPAQAGAGSCIFMHIWRGPGQPTVGCTAMPQADLESLIAWLNPASTPLDRAQFIGAVGFHDDGIINGDGHLQEYYANQP